MRQCRQKPRNYYLNKTGFRHPPQEVNATLKCEGRADTVGVRSGNSGKSPRDSKPKQDPRQVRKIYKICPERAWREAERQGVYRGSADDARDGFIHFSQGSQVAGTARKHFAGQSGLLLIEVDADALGPALRWERSRNDELFPHLYGELDLGAVLGVHDMRARSDGTHEIPELKP
jgi:uncharacterized protein (DUF952 family)